MHSSSNLTELNISNNKSINRSIIELDKLIEVCHGLQALKISNLNMKRSNVKVISESLISKMTDKNSKIHTLNWDGDLKRCPNTAQNFVY